MSAKVGQLLHAGSGWWPGCSEGCHHAGGLRLAGLRQQGHVTLRSNRPGPSWRDWNQGWTAHCEGQGTLAVHPQVLTNLP